MNNRNLWVEREYNEIKLKTITMQEENYFVTWGAALIFVFCETGNEEDIEPLSAMWLAPFSLRAEFFPTPTSKIIGKTLNVSSEINRTET